jgi:3-oxoacyl-[acyl-carrier protein] reductase
MGKLDGRVAVVTGAGRGIGKAIAAKLAEDGAKVLISDIDEESAKATLEDLQSLGCDACTYVGDITDAGFGDKLIGFVLGRYGQLDIIVNNAGYIWNSVIQKHSDEQWQAMIDVHATGPFRILRAASTYFRDAAKREMLGGGARCRKVVNVSSVSGLYGEATQVGYSAGKAALLGMTKTLAKEWGRYNVTVNAVAFGYIETRLTQPFKTEPGKINIKDREFEVGLDAGSVEIIKQKSSLNRSGSPEDAAGAAYLLCIPESDFITGHTLVCSGGW